MGILWSLTGGNVGDSQKVYAILKEYVPGGVIDCYVGSHAHEDHMGAAAAVLNAVKPSNILCPNNSATQKFFSDFLKYSKQHDISPRCPKLGEEFMLGGAYIKILAPFHPNDANVNNTSIALKVTYGKTSFLFTGDAESEEEHDLIGKWGDVLKCNVFKVGHHGSASSSSYLFLKTASPTIGIICVGDNNKYGHPDANVLSRYRDAGITLYQTNIHGDIHILSDGSTKTVDTEKNVKNETPQQEITTVPATYIGNKNSKTFHLPYCKNLPLQKNQVFFSSRLDAIEAGYTPCGNCTP